MFTDVGNADGLRPVQAIALCYGKCFAASADLHGGVKRSSFRYRPRPLTLYFNIWILEVPNSPSRFFRSSGKKIFLIISSRNQSP